MTSTLQDLRDRYASTPEPIVHPTANGYVRSHRVAPGGALTPVVREILAFEERGAKLAPNRETPIAGAPLFFMLDGGFDQHAPDGSIVRHGAAFGAGPHSASVMMAPRSDFVGVQIDLTLYGARRLFGAPLSELVGAVFDLEAVFGAFAVGLRRRLEASDDWRERMALIEFALLDRLARSPEIDRRLAAAARAIDVSGGRLRVGALSEATGVDRGRLAARMRAEFGLSPKRHADLARFDATLRALRRTSGLTLSDAAYGFGYADQSHLTRDFRRFGGAPPMALLRR